MNNITIVKDKCVGCTACMYSCPLNAISMTTDDNGFYFPKLDEQICVDCGKCLRVCPVEVNLPFNNSSRNIYYGYSRDENIRKNSSSGGVFSEIANYVDNLEGVVVSSFFDNEMKIVKHGCNNLDKLRRSKYVESFMSDALETIKKSLKEKKKVLFCGTPCQSAGVRSIFPDEDNLIIVDFVCHGVPSMKLLKESLTYHERKNKAKILDINFRHKIKGWSCLQMKYYYTNGKTEVVDAMLDRYYWMFLNNIGLRSSCYNCKFNSTHKSDIILGDFWGYKYYDKTINDEKGLSLIQTQTEKGKEVLDYCKKNMELYSLSSKDIKYAERNVDNYDIHKRNEFFKQYHLYGFSRATDNFGYINNLNKRKIMVILSNLKYLIKRLRKS